jgi:hypothetical protein
MENSRTERFSLLSGVVAVLLLMAGSVLIGIYDYLPPAEEIAGYVTDNASRVQAGGYLGSISAVFLIWFSSSVRSALASREGGTGRLSNIAFGGGVGAGIAVALGFSAIIAAGSRAGADGGITAIGAITFHDLWGQFLGYANGLMLAVFVAATAIVSLRTDIFPKWFSWLSLLLAIGLITPLNYIFLFGGVAWLVIVSVWLFVKHKD